MAPRESRSRGTFTISKKHFAEIVAHARTGAPAEVCGLLGGKDGRARCLYRATNVERRSGVRYEMDPAQIWAIIQDIEQQGMELVGIYHSHPVSEPTPSHTDIELARYPASAYLIVSLGDPDQPEMRAFNIRSGEVRELPLVIEDY